MSFIFRSDAGIMLIFHLQSGIWEFHFPFTCNLYGKCFGISVTHLTSDLEVPGSSPGIACNTYWKDRPPHLLFSSEFSFFIHDSTSFVIIIIRWSVNDRSPIVFVRIFFLYLLLLFYFYFFPFFVYRLTQDQLS